MCASLVFLCQRQESEMEERFREQTRTARLTVCARSDSESEDRTEQNDALKQQVFKYPTGILIPCRYFQYHRCCSYYCLSCDRSKMCIGSDWRWVGAPVSVNE